MTGEPRAADAEAARRRWQAVDVLLDAALDDAPVGIEHPFPATPADAGEAQAEVERLVGFRLRVGGFLTDSAIDLAGPILDSSPPTLGVWARVTPARIGAYRLVREAGRGGMATVFLAERDDPDLRHRVAIKLLSTEMGDSASERRFLRERQILATLDHPSIARLLDGGITEDGRPWFAMEYVDGVPITRYCDDRRLSVDRRLELFVRVCEAVRFAHLNLIVHRDLKPSNILVSDPGPGEVLARVKLLDFGIAALLAPEPDELGVPLTRAGMVPMTPEYASPEQLDGRRVTTASDVYQLGLVLYELLAGCRPLRIAGLPLREMLRVVGESIPEAPSCVIQRGEAGAGAVGRSVDAVARARSTSPARLRRRLRGDLDTIVLAALRKRPDRRYGSVERLADDVRRHLRSEPVSARPDSWRYRSWTFVRRHRIAVPAIAATALALGASAGAAVVQAGRAGLERDRAEQATAFLVSMFGELEPDRARGVTVVVPRVLEVGVQRARTELAEQPLLEAAVLDGIGQVYELQGMRSEAEGLYEEVLETRLALLGPDDAKVAESRFRLANLLTAKGDYRAESLYRAALATYRRRGGEDDGMVRQIRATLASMLRDRGRYDAADSMFADLVAAGRRAGGARPGLATGLMFLGRLRTRAGDLDEAEALIRESLTMRIELFGREHPTVANSMDALGDLMLVRGDPVSAEGWFREGLRIRAKLFAEDHTDVATGLTYLARALHQQGDLSGADSLLRKAVPVFRRVFGDESPDVADALEHLGEVSMSKGDLTAADSLFRQALAIWRHLEVEPDHDRPRALEVRLRALERRSTDSAPGG